MSDKPSDHPPPAAPYASVPARRQLRSEPELRAALARLLQDQGIALSGRIVSVAGEPDLVTASRDVIYEAKLHLTRRTMHQALGQLLLYRQAINPEARAVIVGYVTPDTIALQPLLAALGVEVLPWEDARAEGWGLGAGEEGTHAPAVPPPADVVSDPTPPVSAFAQFPTPGFQSLHWNVAALARARDIANASALATHLQIARQGLYPIWQGRAAQVSLDMLARIAHALAAEPGDWFTWEPGVGDRGLDSEPQPPPPNRRPLLWRVRERAEVLEVKVTALGFATGLHQRSLGPIWHGEAQAVALETLAKLALALGRPGQPFSIGDLFTWNVPRGEP